MKKTILSILVLPLIGSGIALARQHDTDADNSERNIRDRGGESITAFDQSNEEADLRVVQSIRQTLVANDALSTNAKNVKVITDSRRIVLRGPVKSSQEKSTIDRVAKENANGRSVENQLEVETQN